MGFYSVELSSIGPVTVREAIAGNVSDDLEAVFNGTVYVLEYDRNLYESEEKMAEKLAACLRERVEAAVAKTDSRRVLNVKLYGKFTEALKEELEQDGITVNVMFYKHELTVESEQAYTDFVREKCGAFFTNISDDRPYYPNKTVTDVLGLNGMALMNGSAPSDETPSVPDKFCRQCGAKRKNPEQQFCEMCGSKFK